MSEEPKAMVKLRKRTGRRGYESYEVTIPRRSWRDWARGPGTS